MNTQHKPIIVSLMALVALGFGAWLRLQAIFQKSFAPEAVSDIGLVFLWSGAVLFALAAAAWLFVPTFRPLPPEPLVGRSLTAQPAA